MHSHLDNIFQHQTQANGAALGYSLRTNLALFGQGERARLVVLSINSSFDVFVPSPLQSCQIDFMYASYFIFLKSYFSSIA